MYENPAPDMEEVSKGNRVKKIYINISRVSAQLANSYKLILVG